MCVDDWWLLDKLSVSNPRELVAYPVLLRGAMTAAILELKPARLAAYS
jgi:hypothetical protein